MSALSRAFMALVGFAVLSVYTAAAFVGFLFLQWLFADPPSPLTLVVAFAIGVLIAGFLGYRLGTVRLVASLQAEELPRSRAPELHRRLDRLVAEMRVSKPPLLIADLGAPNALSIGGPRKGVVVLDNSLARLLTIDELEGILAHELAHLESYDTFINTLGVTTMRSLVGLVFLFLFPFVLLLDGVDRSAGWFAGRPQVRLGLAVLFKRVVTFFLGFFLGLFTLAYLAYSRRQEYAADSRAAAVTDNPVALARALSKIHRAKEPRSGLLALLYIHDDRRDDRTELLSTHPPLEERIERLLDDIDHGVRHHYVGRIRPQRR